MNTVINHQGVTVRLSDSRVAIIGIVAAAGTISWKDLRVGFFGEERAKSGSSTSFNTQLKNLINLEALKKTDQGEYELGEWGKKLVQEGLVSTNVVSTARRKAEGTEVSKEDK